MTAYCNAPTMSSTNVFMSTYMTERLADRCDVAYAVDLIGGKWKISIIWELARLSPLRLSALRRQLVGITEGVLIAQLKELECDGLVVRKDFKVVPPHVEYSLAPRAKKLVETIQGLDAWGAACREESARVVS